MKFTPTKLEGAFVVDLETIGDERGFFGRCFCQREMQEHGIDTDIAQVNMSYNRSKGTLRGMHFQAAPHQEGKLVRCIRGSVFDAIVDVRESSSTYLQWFGVELSAENRRALFVPKGFAHGYQTLEEHSEVFYLVSSFYEPTAGRGLRYDDPRVGIEWPLAAEDVSKQDLGWPWL